MGFKELINSYNYYYPENQIVIENLPDYDLLMKDGVGKYLNN
jgi:hypothetical protein